MRAPAMFRKSRLHLLKIGISQSGFLLTTHMHTFVCGVLSVFPDAGGVPRLDNGTPGVLIRVERCVDVRQVGEGVGEVSGVVG